MRKERKNRHPGEHELYRRKKERHGQKLYE
jgi:hypothetical protein